MSLAQLPLEILPHILQYLQWRTRDLYSCCLVSKTWNTYATPRLYSRLFLRDQKRLIKVFQTLQKHSRLAKLLRILEIRVFPFGLQAEDLEQVESNLLASLLQATNLVELYWTRTGSLTDRVIPFLPSLPSLQTLELTGSSRFYSPSNITKYLVAPDRSPNLRHFSILLPDRTVSDELPRWAEQLGSKLESLSILCQYSAIISDDTLKAVSFHLTGIKRLSIAGAKAVTAGGISSLIEGRSIKELALEGLAVHPAHFSQLSRYLDSLESISLTYPKQSLCSPHDFWLHLASFVENLPNLTEFTLYRSSWNTSRIGEEDMIDEGEDSINDSYEFQMNPQEYRRQELEEHANTGRPIIRDPRLSTSFLKRLVTARGSSLKKLRIYGILTTLEQLRLMCESCMMLQDLVVQLFENDKVSLQTSFAILPRLISLHILSPLYSAIFVNEDDLHEIATRSSTTLRQLGFRNRVWLVERSPLATHADVNIDQGKVSRRCLEDGRRVVLQRWDMSSGTFPEVLLVVRA